MAQQGSTVVLMTDSSIGGGHWDWVGPAVEDRGLRGLGNGNHTVSFNVNGFVGRLWIEATLSSNPQTILPPEEPGIPNIDPYYVNPYGTWPQGPYPPQEGSIDVDDRLPRNLRFEDWYRYNGKLHQFPNGRPGWNNFLSLAGGTITTPGTGYAVGNTITLINVGGSQVAPAIITVMSVDGSGGVTSYSITNAGQFAIPPTSFLQLISSGSGSGFTLGDIAFGPFAGPGWNPDNRLEVGLTGGTITAPGNNYALGDKVTLAAVGGAQIFPAVIQVTSVNVSTGILTFSILNPGEFSSLPSSFVQSFTSGVGVGFTLGSPTFSPNPCPPGPDFNRDRGDWFPVWLTWDRPYLEYPGHGTLEANVYYNPGGTGFTGTDIVNFQGLFTFVRARLDRSYLIEPPTQLERQNFGKVVKILMSS